MKAKRCAPTAHKFTAIITSSDYGFSAHRSEGAVIYCQRCGEVRAIPLPRSEVQA